jgi:hypothetical protein
MGFSRLGTPIWGTCCSKKKWWAVVLQSGDPPGKPHNPKPESEIFQ